MHSQAQEYQLHPESLISVLQEKGEAQIGTPKIDVPDISVRDYEIRILMRDLGGCGNAKRYPSDSVQPTNEPHVLPWISLRLIVGEDLQVREWKFES